MNDELEGKHGVQSLEVGISILRAMAAGKRSMMLKDIALAADMPPSKAHRYLVSLIRTGLVEQDRLTSRYDLGPFALNLGLVALDRVDRIRLGLAAITDLRDVTNETIALAVWNDNGPVIVRWERPRKPITVNVLTGTNLRLLSSAAGRVFSAWLPEAQTEATLRQEIESGKAPADIRTLDTLKDFFLKLGFAAVTFSSPQEHDRIIAYTSQLAHIVSSTYIKSDTALSHPGFSAGSFKDMTRVAAPSISGSVTGKKSTP